MFSHPLCMFITAEILYANDVNYILYILTILDQPSPATNIQKSKLLFLLLIPDNSLDVKKRLLSNFKSLSTQPTHPTNSPPKLLSLLDNLSLDPRDFTYELLTYYDLHL